ncbi:MAG: transcriptional regulator TetR/acrR family [Caballeronia sp.]|jgi:TetR/AcrR family transcriptional repressor of mexJK operon|uniref:TetR/AcrR family transcriptional regulator C-terminal domain-containing protein n=1 Tax=Caballeronia sp. TaxID=1931223 RepID=UPI002A3D98AD|nr:transcriptional regulator TetR/acrR family [Caballeronia sp.]
MGRTDSNAKRELLLGIAAERFLASGFSAVSVDELVASAGQSKTNVYSWFGGKEGLFLATIDRLLDAMLVPLMDNRFALLPLSEGLRVLADAVLTIVLGKDALALHRLIIAESQAFPAIGRAWVVAGPERTYRFCADFVEAHQQAGRLRLADPNRAAVFFHDMLTGDLEHRILVGERTMPDAAERDRLIDAVIDVFTRGYAA